LFQTNFLVYGKNIDEERECFLLVTTSYLYVLNQQKKQTEKDRGLGLVAVHKLRELKRVVVGLFYQLFRIEVIDSQNSCYVFITRDHTKTHRFMESLQSAVKECEEIFDPVVVSNKNKEYVKNMSIRLLSGKAPVLHLYLMLFEKQKSSNFKGFGPSKVGAIVPRTLIITDDIIMLCEEDYSHWPSLYGAELAPSTSQFQLKSSHNISDVIEVHLDSSTPRTLKVIFEEENANRGLRETWDLVTQAKGEQKKLIQVLSKCWRQLFKLDLLITST